MRCRICGCTEEKACLSGGVPCHWVEPDLCSACATATGPTADAGAEILMETHHQLGKLQLTMADMMALQGTPPLAVDIGPTPALFLLSAIQIACCHPGLTGEVKATVVQIGQGLQEYLSVTENLAKITAAGWERGFDVPTVPERRIILPGEPGFQP
jgi:hypothetical protein